MIPFVILEVLYILSSFNIFFMENHVSKHVDPYQMPHDVAHCLLMTLLWVSRLERFSHKSIKLNQIVDFHQ